MLLLPGSGAVAALDGDAGFLMLGRGDGCGAAGGGATLFPRGYRPGVASRAATWERQRRWAVRVCKGCGARCAEPVQKTLRSVDGMVCVCSSNARRWCLRTKGGEFIHRYQSWTLHAHGFDLRARKGHRAPGQEHSFPGIASAPRASLLNTHALITQHSRQRSRLYCGPARRRPTQGTTHACPSVCACVVDRLTSRRHW